VGALAQGVASTAEVVETEAEAGEWEVLEQAVVAVAVQEEVRKELGRAVRETERRAREDCTEGPRRILGRRASYATVDW
jgi:hypothetical protein